MAKKEKTEKKAAKKTKKKTGKKKWIFLFILLLLALLSGTGYFFKLHEPAIAFLNETPINFWSGSSEEKELEEAMKAEALSEAIIEVEDAALQIKEDYPEEDIPRKDRYYIKVEECVNLTCQQEVARFLKQERLSFTKRQKTNRTKYFELISSTVYTRQAAKAKIEELKNEPQIKGEPFLRKENNRYRISLGQFPNEETGIKIRAGLVPLYPKLKIDFEIRPRVTYYTVNAFYAGPFQKSAAKSVLKKLQEHPEYETSELTMKL